MNLKINKRSKPRVEYIAGSVPMLVIDDFYEDPDALREWALEHEFGDSRAGYPGRHEMLDPKKNIQIAKVVNHIKKVVEVGTKLPINIGSITTDFSILTTPKEKVLKSQSHPHTDGVALAGLVYLNKRKLGGTCFYRNTLLESMVLVDENRDEYNKIMERFDENFSDVDSYVSDSFDVWELVHKTTGEYNQFVMYPGNVFHSVDVVENPDPNNPKMARLTQRIFVDKIDK